MEYRFVIQYKCDDGTWEESYHTDSVDRATQAFEDEMERLSKLNMKSILRLIDGHTEIGRAVLHPDLPALHCANNS